MKKKILIAALLMAVLFTASSCGETQGETHEEIHEIVWQGQYVYDEDFTIRYEATLNAMFGETWTVVNVEERYDEGWDPCGCGFHGRNPHTYILTTVEFLDGNGNATAFPIDNRGGFARQIERFIASTWIAEYYRKNFIDVYFQDIPLGEGTYVFGFLTRSNRDSQLPENREFDRITREFRQQLSTPEGAIPLYKMTPANVFETFPMYLAISIRLDGTTAHSQEVEESIFRQVDTMLDSMIAYTNNSLNADIIISYQNVISFHGERPRWDILQGERVARYNMSRQVFDSFVGILW